MNGAATLIAPSPLVVRRAGSPFDGGTRHLPGEGTGALAYEALLGDTVVARGSVERLEWDTALFLVPSGRCSLRLLDRPNLRLEEACAAMLRRLLGEAEALGLRHVRYRAPLEDAAAIRAMEAAGFRLVDVGVTLRRDLPAPGLDGLKPRGLIRPGTPVDVALLAPLASELARLSWFNRDPLFRGARAFRLNEAWIEGAFLTPAPLLLVAEHEGRPAGFIAGDLDREAGEADITLVAVDPRASGRGMGKSLLAAALGWLADRVARVRVRTQAYNYRALGLYASVGFHIAGTDATLTRLVGDGEPACPTASPLGEVA